MANQSEQQKRTEARLKRFDALLGASSSSSAESSPSPKKSQKSKVTTVKPKTNSKQQKPIKKQTIEPKKNDKKTSKQPSAESTKTKHQGRQTYGTIMNRVESQLPMAQRWFSRLVRSRVIDGLGNLGAKTIARPSGVLGAGMVAAIGISLLTFVAKQAGFRLAGSELVILLIAGWAIGISIELLIRAINKAGKAIRIKPKA